MTDDIAGAQRNGPSGGGPLQHANADVVAGLRIWSAGIAEAYDQPRGKLLSHDVLATSRTVLNADPVKVNAESLDMSLA